MSLLGLLFASRATRAAFSRGTGERNLYRFECRSVLACEVEELRAYTMGRPRPRALVQAPA